MKIGVLALQGAYQAHKKKIESLGVNCVLIRTSAELSEIDALILPGGESSTMIYLLEKHNMWEMLAEKVNKIPVFATCAGVILLQNLGALKIQVTRNGYGRQLASGIFPIQINLNNQQIRLDAFFIRAPIIDTVQDQEIEILATYEEKPVLVKKDKILAASFHPELGKSDSIHEYFLSLIK